MVLCPLLCTGRLLLCLAGGPNLCSHHVGVHVFEEIQLLSRCGASCAGPACLQGGQVLPQVLSSCPLEVGASGPILQISRLKCSVPNDVAKAMLLVSGRVGMPNLKTVFHPCPVLARRRGGSRSSCVKECCLLMDAVSSFRAL